MLFEIFEKLTSAHRELAYLLIRQDEQFNIAFENDHLYSKSGTVSSAVKFTCDVSGCTPIFWERRDQPKPVCVWSVWGEGGRGGRGRGRRQDDKTRSTRLVLIWPFEQYLCRLFLKFHRSKNTLYPIFRMGKIVAHWQSDNSVTICK